VSPRPHPDGGGARASRFLGSDRPRGGQDWSDSAAPLPGPDPAPGHHVGKCKQRFLVGALVPILENVGDPGRSGEPVQLMSVGPHERVVLLDHELSVACGGQVLDEAAEARCPSCTFGGITASSVVDRCRDWHGCQGRDDHPTMPDVLMVHVETPATWHDQAPHDLSSGAWVTHSHSSDDVPGPLRLVHVNPRRHLPGRPVSRPMVGIVAGRETGVGDGRRSRPSSVAVTPASG
jgi:hypothetical protein